MVVATPALSTCDQPVNTTVWVALRVEERPLVVATRLMPVHIVTAGELL